MGATARAGVRLASALLALGGLGACSAFPEPVYPTGVDLLTIPTPSPDPADYVEDIDNPWLPYGDGARWSYARTVATTTPWTVTVTVEPDRVEIDGVATTAVQSLYVSDPPGAPPFTIDYYAQDTAGNVWWFGRQGEWEAGVDGAQAGLVMPAVPRLGDGWRLGYRPGVMEDVGTVTGLNDEQLVLQRTSDLLPGVSDRLTYERDTGLVAVESLGVPTESLRLVAVAVDPGG